MKGFNEYYDFAKDVLGQTDYEAYQYARRRVGDNRNKNILNMQAGRVFHCDPEPDVRDDPDAA